MCHLIDCQLKITANSYSTVLLDNWDHRSSPIREGHRFQDSTGHQPPPPFPATHRELYNACKIVVEQLHPQVSPFSWPSSSLNNVLWTAGPGIGAVPVKWPWTLAWEVKELLPPHIFPFSPREFLGLWFHHSSTLRPWLGGKKGRKIKKIKIKQVV